MKLLYAASLAVTLGLAAQTSGATTVSYTSGCYSGYSCGHSSVWGSTWTSGGGSNWWSFRTKDDDDDEDDKSDYWSWIGGKKHPKHPWGKHPHDPWKKWPHKKPPKMTPVPLPASGLVLMSGLVGLGVLGRRRKRAS